MDKRDLREAYEIVLADLMSNCGGLPVGRYDAKNGDKIFMYGIWYIMETIAIKAEKQEVLNEIFLKNIDESEKRINGNK